MKYRKGMSYSEIVKAMIVIKTKEEAKEFFDAVAVEAYGHPNIATHRKAVDLTANNLGYLMGYAPDQIDVGLWESVGALHPVFGRGVGRDLTPEQILKKGIELGRGKR